MIIGNKEHFRITDERKLADSNDSYHEWLDGDFYL